VECVTLRIMADIKSDVVTDKWFSLYIFLIVCPSVLFGYLVSMSLLAPILEEYQYYPISNYFYKVLSNVCHQYPSRSFWLMNRPIGLCSRCLGIYSSFFVSLIAIRQLKSRKVVLWVWMLFFPLIMDGFFQYFGLYESNNPIRFCVGVLFGLSGSIYYKTFAFHLSSHLKSVRQGPIVPSTSICLIIMCMEAGFILMTNIYPLMVIVR
jgi:uncharacterized membrane protein